MKKKMQCALTGLALLFAAYASAQLPGSPNPPRLVNDFTNTLSLSEINRLENKLVNFSDSTSNQITVVLLDDLAGFDPAMAAYNIGKEWKVGQKDFNNGIVILVKPKRGNSKGQTFIATGYGLEGAIPDATAKSIVENEMIPEFKNDNYYQGLDKAVNVLMALASGEYSFETYNDKNEVPGWIIFIPLLFVIVILIIANKVKPAHYTLGKKDNSSLWTALFLGSLLGGGGKGGSWKDFNSGSGRFGGGFGGFGGGSFGGGGAGGSW